MFNPARHLPGLTAGGLAAVAAYNWWRWRSDKGRALAQHSARLRRPTLDQPPPISVLVAAWNEAGMIDRHLQSFLALDYPQIELILCAGGSDQTFERALGYASSTLQVLEQQPGEGKQRALARCLEYASGALIYLTDADCLYSDAALQQLVHALLTNHEQVVTGASRPLAEQLKDTLPRYIWAADVFAASHYPTYVAGLLGRNALLRRSALEQSGGLDFLAPTGTDYHLARRLLAAGFRLRYVPASVVQSRYPPTIAEYWRKQARWMRNLLLYGPKYGAYDQVRATLQSAAVGMLMLVLPVLALFRQRGAGALWLVLLAHASLAKVRYASYCALVFPHSGTLDPAGVAQAGWTIRDWLMLAPLTMLDCMIWITPLIDVCIPQRQQRW